MNRAIVNFTLLTHFCVFLGLGCAIGERASLPAVPNDSTWKRQNVCFTQGCNDQITRLAKGTLEITLKSHNDSFRRLGREYFAISFFLRSPVALFLNLSEITLITSSGRKEIPDGFLIRKYAFSQSSSSDRCLGDNFYSRGDIKKYPHYYPTTATLYIVMPDTCYDLVFDVPPPKQSEIFYLNLSGIYPDGHQSILPLIRFE